MLNSQYGSKDVSAKRKTHMPSYLHDSIIDCRIQIEEQNQGPNKLRLSSKYVIHFAMHLLCGLERIIYRSGGKPSCRIFKSKIEKYFNDSENNTEKDAINRITAKLLEFCKTN